MKKPILIGITVGQAQVNRLYQRKFLNLLKNRYCNYRARLYYKDQSHLSFDERVKTNYDHPFAFDNELLIQHLNDLIDRKPIEKPIYDFEKHNRKKETILVEPKDIIILEGILILSEKEIRDLLDIKIFVDTDSDVRVIRRIQRDIEDRGRTLDSVILQYMNTVRPAHLQFVEPTKDMLI